MIEQNGLLSFVMANLHMYQYVDSLKLIEDSNKRPFMGTTITNLSKRSNSWNIFI